MKIHVHITCWNEQKILPFTLAHYSSFCDKIFVHDNMSTDMSPFICTDFPNVKVDFWDGKAEKGKFNDNEARWIKHDAYIRESRAVADWVILADCDELIYHPNIVEVLEGYMRRGINYPIIQGYDMVSEDFPPYSWGSQITDLVKTGVGYDPFPPDKIYTEEESWGYSKPIVFNPALEVKLSVGSHFITSRVTQELPPPSDIDKFVFSEEADIKLLHYKNLSEDYVVERCRRLGERLSNYNIKKSLSMGWLDDEGTKNHFRSLLKNSKIVI